jgi:hypothetical protein
MPDSEQPKSKNGAAAIGVSRDRELGIPPKHATMKEATSAGKWNS